MYSAINKTSKQQNIGGKLVYPGESRVILENEVHEALKKGFEVPGYEAEAQTEVPEALKQPFQLSTEELIEMTVKEIEAILNELTNDQILVLESAEKLSEAPRKTLLDAIVKEISERD